MPRNAAGVYSLPAGNPVVSGTTITSTWGNATASDIGSELTNSLDRGGRGAMTAALQLVDGAAATPGLCFATEVGMGLSRVSAGLMGISLAAAEAYRLGAQRIGHGIAGSAWPATYFALEQGRIGNAHFGLSGAAHVGISSNAFYDGAWKYGADGLAGRLTIVDGVLSISLAVTGLAGDAITFPATFGITQAGSVRTILGWDTSTRGGYELPAVGYIKFGATAGANTAADGLLGTGAAGVLSWYRYSGAAYVQQWTVDASGNMTATGNVTAYSDERLKKDFSSARLTLEQMLQVQPVRYTRIDNEQRQVGVKAQELKSVLPEAVMEDDKGVHSVDYGKAALVMVLSLAQDVHLLRRGVG